MSDKRSIRVYNDFVAALIEQGRYSKAIEVCKQAIANNPKDPNVYNNYGATLMVINKFEEAFNVFNYVVVKIDPKNFSAYRHLGIVLMELGERKEAFKAFKRALALDPYNVLSSDIAFALLILGKNEEAAEAYKKAIALDPKNPHHYSDLGSVLSCLDRREEAIEAYKKSIALDPKNQYPYIAMGYALDCLGRSKEAEKVTESFRKAMAVDSNTETILDKSKDDLENRAENDKLDAFMAAYYKPCRKTDPELGHGGRVLGWIILIIAAILLIFSLF